jgi:hypothetical protein
MKERASSKVRVRVPACIAAIAIALVAADGGAQTLAETAQRECGRGSASEKIACYEAVLHPVARAGELERALTALEAIAEADPDVRRDGHLYVHGLGIAAYDAERDVAETFTRCTELFHAGCYHGVIQAYFSESGEADSARVNGLCTQVRRLQPGQWTYFQCVHGLGHGLTILNRHDLRRGLEGCDLLAGGWERESCYGGAFMENVGNATHPHHASLMKDLDTAEEPDAHAHGDHGDAHPAAEGIPFRPVDPDDPHYPCTAIAERYGEACYGMQTTVMLHLNGSDFEAAARTCDGAPQRFRRTCHQSLGRDASGYAQQDADETRRLCALDRSAEAPWCYVGAVKAITDWTGTPDAGLSFCRDVAESEAKIRCYEAVGEQIGVMVSEDDGRADACAAAAPPDRDVCLYGARVIAEKPAVLRALDTGG